MWCGDETKDSHLLRVRDQRDRAARYIYISPCSILTKEYILGLCILRSDSEGTNACIAREGGVGEQPKNDSQESVMLSYC